MTAFKDDLVQAGFVNRTLRDHQQEGVEWLCNCFHNQNGSILADEMGLGKTTQSLSFLCLKVSVQIPSLVVAPLSVVNNWLTEFSSFLPKFNVLKYYGDAETRSALQQMACDVIITTYEMLLKDSTFFVSKKWNIVIIDEGHRLKNSEGQTNMRLREVNCGFRLILSGTPVQNNMKELYTLLSFIDNQAFPLDDLADFCDRYEKEKYSDELHELLRPYLLRRTKNQVLTKLPPSQESIIFCELTALQKSVYKGCLVKDSSVIDLASNKSVLQNTIMQLRKCSNHPYMFNGIEPEPFCMGEHLVEASGKLKTLDNILKYCKSNLHRVLIFSQFTLTLDILQDYATYRKFSYERLDGSVRDQERYTSINNFSDNNVFCFLLSTRAGGVGLNLTAADTVVFFDTDWNPQNDIQAAARAHRIGQTKPVKIIRLISKNTVDEYMLKRMESKLKLTKRVITEGGFSSFETAAGDSKTLSDMLMFGLSSLLDGNDDSDNDIESVLGETSSIGEWVFDSKTADQNGKLGNEVDDFYDFEGTNYRDKKTKDKKAFDKLVEESVVSTTSEDNEVSSVRARNTISMTAEEFKENENLLEKQRKAALEQRRATREAKKKEKWLEMGYNSTALSSCDLPDNLSSSTLDLEYVVGDVTQSDKAGAIIHCTDSSGDWGSGGLFTALSKQSPNPKNCYELAKDMDDLRLGQCHLVDYASDLSVALLVCIKRGPSSLKLDLKSLGEALTSLSSYAEEHSITIHMPRIGFSTNDWYGVERLLRKCLLSQDIPTIVYYYSRGSRQSRNTPTAASTVSSSNSSPKPGPSGLSNQLKRPLSLNPRSIQKHQKSQLPDLYTDKVVYLDPSLSASEQAVLRRYVMAANGDIQVFLDENITHIVSYNASFYKEDCSTAVIINPYEFQKTIMSHF